MDDFWKPLALIIGATVLIALGMIFFGIGSGDVGGMAPHPEAYRHHPY